jgi:hypothetical protein
MSDEPPSEPQRPPCPPAKLTPPEPQPIEPYRAFPPPVHPVGPKTGNGYIAKFKAWQAAQRADPNNPWHRKKRP